MPTRRWPFSAYRMEPIGEFGSVVKISGWWMADVEFASH
jgi:hypothetical protein